ncbi:hypothetical protein [Alloprevotella tannerae]|mgnify:FL=1|uniref:hypothetical protein n=1 Tax=Alloprevotella tannerae TaxID=76122 RepID=UPI0028D64CDF|nr:hypothetical protein [Alloprevotella tannerae]
MKKLYKSIFSVALLLCGLTVSLTACSHDGSEDMPEEPQQSGDTILATISQATGAHIGQDVNGLKVGDSIYYNLTIDDPKAPKSATYTLDLDGVGSTYNHRRFNKDFTLHISKIADDGSTNDWQQITEFPYTLPSKGRYRLMYVAKSDGTFIHEFKLCRYVNNKPSRKVTNFSVVFNVLDIDLIYALRDSFPGLSLFVVGVKIKCGDFATDRLFEPKGRSFTYKIIYNGHEFRNSFKPGVLEVVYFDPINYDSKKGPDIENKIITELVVEVKAEDSSPVYFQYKNLPMRRDDSLIKKKNSKA